MLSKNVQLISPSFAMIRVIDSVKIIVVPEKLSRINKFTPFLTRFELLNNTFRCYLIVPSIFGFLLDN